MPEVKDKDKAKRLLERSLKEIDADDKKQLGIVEEVESRNVPIDLLPQASIKQSGRSEQYQNPFDEFDPHHRINGKKMFNDSIKCL